MIQDKIQSLQIRHRELDEQVKKGYSNYLDDPSLHKLKQEKLYIKDQIEKLSKQI